MAIVNARGAKHAFTARSGYSSLRLFRMVGHAVMVDLVKQLSPPYLRLQADRCQRLSRNCMDLGTARDLRIMAEEYFAEASEMEARISAH